MFHGHGVSIDMAFSATIAQRRGYISVSERNRILGLMSRIGLAIDSSYLTAELLWKATESISKTRDGLLQSRRSAPDRQVFLSSTI